MNDVSPGILEAVKKQFDILFYQNAKIKRIYEKVRKGKASFAEMKTFAEMAGDILSEALDKVFTEGNLPDGKLYQNIAEKVITPMLQQNYSLVNEVCGYVMDDKNTAARIGVRAVAAEFNADRAEKIAQIAANSGGVKKGSKAAQLITNMSLSFVDAFIQVNADMHKDLGMMPQIQRIYHGKPGACEFCERLAYSDAYKGPKMPAGIFQRHRDCKCTLIYEPRKGKYQDPWSKKEAAEYEQLVSDQRSYLTELDKMTPGERKLARNARARELRRSKYSASEWNERKAMQARMQRIKEKENNALIAKAAREEQRKATSIKIAANTSRKSIETSLRAIRNGKARLSTKRKMLLKRVPESGNYHKFKRNEITIHDLAYLSAATGHEFALFRGKRYDVLVHGTVSSCNVYGTFADELLEGYEWVAHSHVDLGPLVASADDRATLRKFKQKTSIIIGPTGKEIIFTDNEFD